MKILEGDPSGRSFCITTLSPSIGHAAIGRQSGAPALAETTQRYYFYARGTAAAGRAAVRRLAALVARPPTLAELAGVPEETLNGISRSLSAALNTPASTPDSTPTSSITAPPSSANPSSATPLHNPYPPGNPPGNPTSSGSAPRAALSAESVSSGSFPRAPPGGPGTPVSRPRGGPSPAPGVANGVGDRQRTLNQDAVSGTAAGGANIGRSENSGQSEHGSSGSGRAAGVGPEGV